MNMNRSITRMSMVLDYIDPALRKDPRLSEEFEFTLKLAHRLKKRHENGVIKRQKKLKELPTRPIHRSQEDRVFSVQRMILVKETRIKLGREITVLDERIKALSCVIRALNQVVRKQHFLRPLKKKPKRVTEKTTAHCASVLRAMGALPSLKPANCKAWPKCSCIARGNGKDCATHNAR